MYRHLAALFFALSFLGAQTPVIKVTTRLMQVSVLVENKQGDPVADLTKDDFVLYDRGRLQKILYFAKELGDLPVDRFGDRPGDGPGEDAGESEKDAVSNRFIAIQQDGKTKLRPLPNSLTAILLDGLNTSFPDQKLARESLIHFLKQLTPGDQVAIYTLTDGLQVLHDFTTDTAALLAALSAAPGTLSPALAASTYADAHTPRVELDALINRGNAAVARNSRAKRAITTLRALQALANYLAGLPGRKNLIWVAGGFPVAPSARVFNDGDIAIYPVDARGLPGMADWFPAMNASTDSRAFFDPGEIPMDGRAQDDTSASRAAMNLLAAHTGGRVCVGSNDIGRCIHRAVADARVSYTLSYAPSHDDWHGEFREIRIKLNRPGLEARYRKGYYAFADSPVDAKTKQELLMEAGLSPLPSTGLTIAARLIEKPSLESPTAALAAVIEGRDVSFTRNAQGQQEAVLDLRMVVFGAQPAPLGVSGRTVHLSLKPEQYEIMMKGGVRVKLNVEVPAKALRIRLVARDAATGRVGSLDIPLS